MMKRRKRETFYDMMNERERTVVGNIVYYIMILVLMIMLYIVL